MNIETGPSATSTPAIVAPKKGKRKSNPNGANQHLIDPRQQFFLAYYLDPKSETFSNALQSALKAGYAQEYAENLLSKLPDWLTDKVGKLNLLAKAERNLEEFLELPSKVQAMGPFGPLFEMKETTVKLKNGKKKKKKVKGDAIMVYAGSLLKVKADVTKFVAERIGKSDYGKDEPAGGDVYNTVIFADGQRTKIAKRIIGGGQAGSVSSKK
jgi:hypothetical protein